MSVGSKLQAQIVATRLRSWFIGHLGLHQFGFRRGKGVGDALQVARRLVEEVVTSTGGGEGVDYHFMTSRRLTLEFVEGLCGIFC